LRNDDAAFHRTTTREGVTGVSAKMQSKLKSSNFGQPSCGQKKNELVELAAAQAQRETLSSAAQHDDAGS
jgi:hypothetical protein